MGYKEALEDGIRISKSGGGDNWYYPKCSDCGTEVSSWGYRREIKYLCKECKTSNALSDKKTKAEDGKEIKERKFYNAFDRVSKVAKPKDGEKYVIAADVIYKNLHKPNWFDSTEEIMVAIELIKNGLKAKHQVKFGERYKADFVLPDLKVVLEVDGVCYHTERTRAKEDLRDSLILASLGPEWEVIRITDELINKNVTKLVPAIKAIRKERAKVRESNNGMLPYWYTDRKLA